MSSRHTQQLLELLTATRFARGRLIATNEEFLLVVALLTSEFVQGHGESTEARIRMGNLQQKVLPLRAFENLVGNDQLSHALGTAEHFRDFCCDVVLIVNQRDLG